MTASMLERPRSKLRPGAGRAVGGFFFAPCANFANCVDAAALTLEVGPRQHLAQEPCAEKNYSGHQGERPDQQQRAMFVNNVAAEPEFLNRHTGEQQSARTCA